MTDLIERLNAAASIGEINPLYGEAGDALQVAKEYCKAYDEYQTLFALHKLRGWTGVFDGQGNPKDLVQAHDKMVEVFDALHISVGLGPRPNYVERAKEGKGSE